MGEIELRWLTIQSREWKEDYSLPRYEYRDKRVLQFRLTPESDWQDVDEVLAKDY